MTGRVDVCVIGAGAAGLSFAAGAVQMGASVVLIESGKMGGDCLNYGCVPSKALLAAAKVAHGRGQGGALGIGPATAEVDFAAVQDHVARTIAAIAPHDSQERFEGLGVRVIRATARFTSPRTVEAAGETITARRFIIATGSRPSVPPVPGLDAVPFLTNETIFGLSERPQHLLILGGGPIGLEMAQAHRRLGAEVTVVEAARCLSREDPDLAAPVLEALRAEGVTIREGAKAVEAGPGPRLVLEDGTSVAGSHLLVATGRAPNTETLNLDAAGIAYDRSGIRVDKGLRTTNRRVYALGDVAGQGQFTHLAGYHAGIAIRPVLFGLLAKARTEHVPRVTYTDPELAQIGLTEAEARARHGDRLTVITTPYDENDRARAQGVDTGLMKLMVVRGRPVGVGITGPQAGELIGLWALVTAQGLSLKAVSGTVLPYPTLSELSKRAASGYFSPKLFDNPLVKAVVGTVQRFLP